MLSLPRVAKSLAYFSFDKEEIVQKGGNAWSIENGEEDGPGASLRGVH